ncbi:MAG: hypothetical protein IPL38_12060 [Rhodobacter sp.]|nr:hypothetical protein [Rhodobacter sp.]
MSQRIAPVLVLSALLAGCGGNPFLDAPVDPGPDPDLPEALPGTPNPTRSSSIVRYEAREAGTGNGYAEGITYDPGTDTFSVDNLRVRRRQPLRARRGRGEPRALSGL